MDEFNLEKLCSDHLSLRAEMIALGGAIGMISAIRVMLLMGQPRQELCEIAMLLDTALLQADKRIQVIPELLGKVNREAQLAVELLKTPVASAKQ